MIYVSATPGQEELEKSRSVVEQLIRPTGLAGSRDRGAAQRGPDGGHLRRDPQAQVAAGERTLVTDPDQAHGRGAHRVPRRSWASRCATSTPRSRPSSGWRSSRDLRAGRLRRPGRHQPAARRASTCPRSRFIAILDADKIGFLRSATSLIQIIGRAARNADRHGRHVRRPDVRRHAASPSTRPTGAAAIQAAYNAGARHHARRPSARPSTTSSQRHQRGEATRASRPRSRSSREPTTCSCPSRRRPSSRRCEAQMLEHAKNLEFERGGHHPRRDRKDPGRRRLREYPRDAPNAETDRRGKIESGGEPWTEFRSGWGG
ncbi:MAG: hypothetical protein MZV70_05880 [Desulfobacterales bacterium]|nr:hypothetical protein [Desulfobacterales bacterium]